MNKQYIVSVNGKDAQVTNHSVEAGAGKAGKPLIIKAGEAAVYNLVELGIKAAPHNIQVKRHGDDLSIAFGGGDIIHPDIIIENYYQHKGFLSGTSEEGLYSEYFPESGNPSELAYNISGEEVYGLALGYTPADMPSFLTALSAASNMWMAGLPALGLLSGGGATAPAAVALAKYVVQVAVVLGDVKDGAEVAIYDQDGNQLGKTAVSEANTVVKNGLHYVSFEITNGYKGALLALAVDANGTASNYVDETSDALTSMGITHALRGLAIPTDAQQSDGGTVVMQVTALTDLALQKAGLTAGQNSTTLPTNAGAISATSLTEVAKWDAAIGKFFGITTGLQTPPDVETDGVDQSTDAGKYGMALSIFSGGTALNAAAGSTQAASKLTDLINTLAKGIVLDSSGTNAIFAASNPEGEAARASIINAAIEYGAKNADNAANNALSYVLSSTPKLTDDHYISGLTVGITPSNPAGGKPSIFGTVDNASHPQTPVSYVYIVVLDENNKTIAGLDPIGPIAVITNPDGSITYSTQGPILAAGKTFHLFATGYTSDGTVVNNSGVATSPIVSFTNDPAVGAVDPEFAPLVCVLDPGSDSGAKLDKLTNDSTPAISGKGQPGAKITVLAPTGESQTATVNSSGNWTVQFNTPLADGNAKFDVRQQLGEKTSKAEVVVGVDTSVAAPSVKGNDTGTATITPSTDGNVKSMEIKYVDEKTGTERTLIATKDPVTGKWSILGDAATWINADSGVVTIPADKILDGSDVTAIAKDDAGKASPEGKAFAPDSTPPTIHILGPVAGDDIINLAESSSTVVIHGTTDAQVGQVVTVTLNGITHTATVLAGGAWSVDWPASDVLGLRNAQGPLNITADVKDQAGNGAPQDTHAIIIVTTAPASPKVNIVKDISGDDGTTTKLELPVDISSSAKIFDSTHIKVKVDFTDAQEGDMLTVWDNAGNTQVMTLTATQATAGTINLDFPIPYEGAKIIVKAKLVNVSGNSSTPDPLDGGQTKTDDAYDETVLNQYLPSTPIVSITSDTNNDGILSVTETTSSSTTWDVKVSFVKPSDENMVYLAGSNNAVIDATLSKIAPNVGDKIIIEDPSHAGITKSFTLTQTDIDNGYITTTWDKPADGVNMVLKTYIEDTASQVSEFSIDQAVKPVLGADVATVSENAGVSTDTLASGHLTPDAVASDTVGGTNLLANDTAGLHVLTVKGSADAAAVNAGTESVGNYGSITINADGTYIYKVNNSNSTVQALASATDKLHDIFTYTATGGLSTTLDVTITGSNDAPTLVDAISGLPSSSMTGNASLFPTLGETSTTFSGQVYDLNVIPALSGIFPKGTGFNFGAGASPSDPNAPISGAPLTTITNAGLLVKYKTGVDKVDFKLTQSDNTDTAIEAFVFKINGVQATKSQITITSISGTTALSYLADGSLAGGGGNISVSSATPITSFEILETEKGFGAGATLTFPQAVGATPATLSAGATIASLMPTVSDVDTGHTVKGYAVTSAPATTSGTDAGKWEYNDGLGTAASNWHELTNATSGAAIYLSANTKVRWNGSTTTHTALSVSAVDNSYTGTTFSAANVVNVNATNKGGSTAFSKSATLAAGTGPVVVDLNHDGAISYHQTTMDIAGTGILANSTWVASQDGVINWDKYGDGVLHDASQYTFSDAASGVTDLQRLGNMFDSNHDGVLNSSDTNFGKLQVWQDANGDGKFEAGEMHSLSSLGITSINLTTDGAHSNPAAGVTDFGHTSATYADGSTTLVADVLLDYTPNANSGHINLNTNTVANSGAAVELTLDSVLANGAHAAQGVMQVVIDGDASDTINLSNVGLATGWQDTGAQTVQNGVTYEVYQATLSAPTAQGDTTAQLLIEQHIHTVVI